MDIARLHDTEKIPGTFNLDNLLCKRFCERLLKGWPWPSTRAFNGKNKW